MWDFDDTRRGCGNCIAPYEVGNGAVASSANDDMNADQDCAKEPLNDEKDADATLPGNGAHRVGAVAVVIHRVDRAQAGGIVPTIGVVGRAVWVVASVVGLQRRVEPVHPCVHSRHDRSAAGDVEGGFKQIVTAAGMGSEAALAIFEDLANPYWKRGAVSE